MTTATTNSSAHNTARATDLLVVEALDKAFGGVIAARNVTFSVARGEMVALIGPNGAGKSTTFNMVGGQLKPDRGHITATEAGTIAREAGAHSLLLTHVPDDLGFDRSRAAAAAAFTSGPVHVAQSGQVYDVAGRLAAAS